MPAIFISAVAEGESTFNLLLPAPADLIWGSVAFAIVAIAVYLFAWPKFAQLLDERGEKIEKGLKAAETARTEVDAERERLEDEILAARRAANEIRDGAHDEAKEIVSDAQGKARAESEVILENAQQRIAADAESARRVLSSDIGALATELAGRIVGEAITDEALAHRVVDRFLDDLEANLVAEKTTAQQEI